MSKIENKTRVLETQRVSELFTTAIKNRIAEGLLHRTDMVVNLEDYGVSLKLRNVDLDHGTYCHNGDPLVVADASWIYLL